MFWDHKVVRQISMPYSNQAKFIQIWSALSARRAKMTKCGSDMLIWYGKYGIPCYLSKNLIQFKWCKYGAAAFVSLLSTPGVSFAEKSQSTSSSSARSTGTLSCGQPPPQPQQQRTKNKQTTTNNRKGEQQSKAQKTPREWLFFKATKTKTTNACPRRCLLVFVQILQLSCLDVFFGKFKVVRFKGTAPNSMKKRKVKARSPTLLGSWKEVTWLRARLVIDHTALSRKHHGHGQNVSKSSSPHHRLLHPQWPISQPASSALSPSFFEHGPAPPRTWSGHIWTVKTKAPNFHLEVGKTQQMVQWRWGTFHKTIWPFLDFM